MCPVTVAVVTFFIAMKLPVALHLQPHGVHDGEDCGEGRPSSQAKYHISSRALWH
jgi:hypothetical protein